MMNNFRLYIVYLFMWLIPATRFFGLKRSLYRWCGATIGSNVRIVSSVRFHLTGKLTIEGDTWVGHEVLIVGGNTDVSIGANCDIAPRVCLVTGSHRLGSVDGRAAGEGYSEAIRIEDGVWIGASATILGGVTIGKRCMVAAGALVRENIPENVLVAGVPARQVRSILKYSPE